MTVHLNAPATSPVQAPPVLLGEVIAWKLPRNVLTTKADLVNALSLAGLDTKLARDLCLRHAFVRACRKLEAARIIRKVEENQHRLRFQFTREHLDVSLRRMDYAFDAMVDLDKDSGDVTSSDGAMEALAKSELAKALEERRTSDVTRILMACFRKEAHIAPIKGGVFFVPSAHIDLIRKVENFCIHLQGRLDRMPVPDGTVQGNNTVAVVMNDSFMDLMVEAKEVIRDFNETTRDSTLVKAQERLDHIANQLWEYEKHLGPAKAILEDNLGLVAAYLRQRSQEVQDAKKAAKSPAPTVTVEVVCPHCGERHQHDGTEADLACAECGMVFHVALAS